MVHSLVQYDFGIVLAPLALLPLGNNTFAVGLRVQNPARWGSVTEDMAESA